MEARVRACSAYLTCACTCSFSCVDHPPTPLLSPFLLLSFLVLCFFSFRSEMQRHSKIPPHSPVQTQVRTMCTTNLVTKLFHNRTVAHSSATLATSQNHKREYVLFLLLALSPLLSSSCSSSCLLLSSVLCPLFSYWLSFLLSRAHLSPFLLFPSYLSPLK